MASKDSARTKLDSKVFAGLSPTISKDNCGGDAARKSQLLAEFGRKNQVPIISFASLSIGNGVGRGRGFTVDSSDALQEMEKSEMINAEPADFNETTLDTISDPDAATDYWVVRCVCGFEYYPGPPLKSGRRARSSARNSKDKISQEDNEFDELLVQCHTCMARQHRGCVGIPHGEAAPEKYYCELCRGDLHRLSRARDGQKYSQYLPFMVS